MFYLNDTINPRPLTPQIVVLYPQNGDRIVAIDAVTSSSPYVMLKVTQSGGQHRGRKSGVSDGAGFSEKLTNALQIRTRRGIVASRRHTVARRFVVFAKPSDAATAS